MKCLKLGNKRDGEEKRRKQRERGREIERESWDRDREPDVMIYRSYHKRRSLLGSHFNINFTHL